MASAATRRVPRRHQARRHADRGHRSVLAICGSLIALFGVVLATMGAFSSFDSGSFPQLAGCGLILSGALLARRHVTGAWAYMAVFAGTLTWSLQDAGFGGSSVTYRIVGPIIMLVMLALLMPALRRWSRARTISVLSVLIIATVLVGDLSDASKESAADPTLAALQIHNAQTKGVLQ
jgi:quinoprotein glucose dehydrogenase